MVKGTSMPWTNRLRESSELRILSLPPPPPPPPPPAAPPPPESLPATCLCMIDSSTRFNDFIPFLCCDRVVLARSLRYCQVTVEKLKQTGIEVMWHGKRDNEGSHYCAQCEVRCLTKALFSHTIFSYNTFVISRLLIGGGLSSVRITTLEMTQWWRNLFTSASLVRLSEKL